jgi:hypothetical protein
MDSGVDRVSKGVKIMVIIIIISGSTALYGPRPPLARLLGLAHLWQFGDQPTGRAVQLNPDVTARARVRRLG